MNYSELLRKKALYEQGKDTLPKNTANSCMQAFELEYTHNSTAIEGNTLTLEEIKMILNLDEQQLEQYLRMLKRHEHKQQE